MISFVRFLCCLSILISITFTAPFSRAEDSRKIILIAGEVKEVDRVGHHDYLGGCRLMQALLKQTSEVEPVLVEKDWPADESVFDGAKAL
ncbi:MAG: hypothetical protein KDL87_19150, partial [Verrucomicrobiae bacterium]|nr:hypothetical protein [Verrucomicrobiae bacterium]